MITFCKKNIALMFALVFLWGFLFVFFPFHHYHLENIHAHPDELSPHQHLSSIHSHDFEASDQVAYNHSPEPLQDDEKHHHSHSPENQGSGNYEISLHKSSLKPESPFKIVKNGDVHRSFVIAKPILFSFVFPDRLPIESSGPPDSPKERSPPSFLI